MPPLPVPPTPEHGRIRRFAVGDWVRVSWGGSEPRIGQVDEWVCDPHPIDFAHCGGNSARYRFKDHLGWYYDYQLEPFTLRELALLVFGHELRTSFPI